MSDRIAVMFEGGMAQLDEAEALYRRPASRRVAEFIGTMNLLPATVEGGTAEVAGLGGVPVAEMGHVSDGEGTVAVGMRPESWTLLAPSDPAPPRVTEGTVAEVVYYGDMTYYDVALPGAERPVRVSMRNLFGREVLDLGAPARLGWSPGAMVLFR